MIPPETPFAPEPGARRPFGRIFARVASFALVMGFYLWAVSPGTPLFKEVHGEGSYYNLLIKGFNSGHLSLAVEVPPGLIALKDPYDPAQNAPFGMHDASYYKGKMYLYFGVAPALTVYWPFHALTGRYIDDPQAIFLLCCVGFIAAASVVLLVRRDYFPRLGTWAESAGILAVGMATMVPVLLRRSQFYEVAVSSGFASYMVFVLALYQSMHARRRLAWLCLASLAYGLAIASRPTYLFGGVVLLLPVLAPVLANRAKGAVTWSGFLPRALAAFVPIGLVMAGLMVYNYERFESPFEFGQKLALSGSEETKIVHFSLSYVAFNCRAYLLAPAQLSSYFPFVRVVFLPVSPKGHFGIEDPYGILPNMPFAVLALLAPLACMRRPNLGVFASCVAVASAATMAVLLMFQFATNRYMVDFLPGFIVLAAVGFFGFLDCLRGGARRLAGIAGLVALFWSAGFNMFAAFGHNELLRANNPLVFSRMLHAFDTPRFLWDKFSGRKYGPIEFTVRFPTDKTRKVEPLVITGSEFLSDYLYVFYSSPDSIVLGFEHAGYGGPVTDPIPVDYAKSHRITVDMPTLYPPEGDPYYDRIPKRTFEAFSARLQVLVDGKTAIDTVQKFHPPFSTDPSVGMGLPGQDALGHRFTGEITGIHRLDADWDEMTRAAGVGPLAISIIFPEGKASGHEPVVCSGVTGRADVLVVNYLDAHRVSFTLDHWGYGGPTSEPFEVERGKPVNLEVRFGSFFPAEGRPPGVPIAVWTEAAGKLLVIINRKTVIETQTPFYDNPVDTLVVGRNTVGASSCAAEFSGKVLGSLRTSLR